LKAMHFIPMASDVDAYAEAIAYQQTDGYGKAKIVANDARSAARQQPDRARPDAGQDHRRRVHVLVAGPPALGPLALAALGASRCARARPSRKASTRSCTLGDADTGLIGFTNVSTVTIGAAAASSGATALQMYGDMVKRLHRGADQHEGHPRGDRPPPAALELREGADHGVERHGRVAT
jgi:hypothetical protein